jgi:RecA-family ATPase
MPVRPDVDQAVEHLTWLTKHQAEGYLLLCVHGTDGKRLLAKFLDNRSPRLLKVVRSFVEEWANEGVHLFYGVNAFSEKSAKAEHVLESRIAHVDADKVALPPAGPPPTRIIGTSPGNHQFLYVLDQYVPGGEIGRISRSLTYLVGGDKGGHSPAKLLRLPGSINVKPKYRPKPVVEVISSDGPIHHASDLLKSRTSSRELDTEDFSTVERDAQSVDTDDVIARYKGRLSCEMLDRIRQRHSYTQFSVRINGRSYTSEADNRSDLIMAVGQALHRAGANPAEALAVIWSTCFWKERAAEGKRENPVRLITKIFTHEEEQPHILAIDPSDWASKPIPERRWVVPDLVPVAKVTGLYGDGGTGKTLLAVQLSVAVALGLKFLGMPVRQGRVYALLAENDEDDSHLTFNSVCRHYEVSLSDLKGLIKVASRAGLDSTLLSLAPKGLSPTPLLDELFAEIQQFSPTLIVLETAADLFGGNENDRGQVRRFISECCTSIAVETGAAVLLCAHPSVAGLKSGEGTGGSTAWNNAVRGRLYLRRELENSDHEPDPDRRILELKKANLTQRGKSIELRWKDGAFVLDEPQNLAGAIKQNREIDQIVSVVEEQYDSNNPFSAYAQAGHRYLVRWITDTLRKPEAAAKKLMRTALSRGQIIEISDPHNHRKCLGTPEQAAMHKGAMKRSRGS